MRIVDTGN